MNRAGWESALQQCPLGARSHSIRGALDLVVLCVLERGEIAEHEVAGEIERLSDDRLVLVGNHLHQSLERLQFKGWVAVRWPAREAGAGCLHRLTAVGARRLEKEKEAWLRLSQAVSTLVQMAAVRQRPEKRRRPVAVKTRRYAAAGAFAALAEQFDPARRCA